MTAWRAVGRTTGGDEIEPADFTIERSGDRWLLTSNGRLIVVGDPSRDLVASAGGLQRRPAGHGFKAYLSVSLMRKDAPTSVGRFLKADGVTIDVDELVTDPTPAAEFGLLDLVPEVDLSARTNSPELTPLLTSLEEASGLRAEAMWGDLESFRLILSNGQPQALITRQHDTAFGPAVFGGIQDRWSDGEWTRHVDTASDDPMWVRGIVRALDAALT